MDTDVDATGRPPHLLDLPFDLQLYLISFLEPLEILHLRTTCTALHHATSQSIVWIEALQQVCLESAVFWPTFPHADMSLAELEYAAMAPYKWLSLSTRPCPDPDTLAARSRFLSPMPSEAGTSDGGEVAEEDDFDIRWLFLVPGGRYLITFSWRWIVVWDLGFSPYRGRGSLSKVIAKTKVPLHSMYLVHASPDGLALYILISSLLIENDETSPEAIAVYEIYPDHRNPQLSLIATLVVPGDEEISFYSLSGNRLIFLQGSVFKIWDFKTNEWINWTVEGEFHQSIVARNFVLLLHSAGVSLWPIPPLGSSSPPFSVVDPTPIQPLFNLSYRTSRSAGNEQYAGPCDWYSGTYLPLTYDIATTTSPTDVLLYRYEVVVRDDLRHAALVEYPALHVLVSGEELVEFDAYRFCRDALVALWYEPDTEATRLHTSPARPAIASAAPVQTAMFTPTHAVASFCPVSGRYVYIETDNGADMDSDDEEVDAADGVVVLEFLPISPEVLPLRAHNRSRSASPQDMATDGRWMDELTGWTATAYSPTQF